MAVDPRKDPHAHFVRTPLPSQGGHAQAQAKVKGADRTAPGPQDPFIRAENEDDDGYDPYSDRPEERPFFEENPWD